MVQVASTRRPPRRTLNRLCRVLSFQWMLSLGWADRIRGTTTVASHMTVWLSRYVKHENVAIMQGTGYTWEIRSGCQRYLVDARPLSSSNWMRYINCANTEEEQNLVAYQYKGDIYYRTYKNVAPGSELLVWYGNKFGRELGIGTKNSRQSTSQDEVPEEDEGDQEQHKADPFKCTSCESVFSSEEYLRKHEKAKHSSKEGRKHQCTHCSYSSDRIGHLKRHERIHTGEKPYLCHVCSKGFTQKSNLVTHVKTLHEGERNHECSTCGMTFQLKQNVQKHERVHSNVRPYVCQHCNKAFTGKSDLSKHLRIHSGDKPYSCSHCGRTFNCPGNLRKHVVNVHTKDYPHKCHLCQQGFRAPCLLRRHLQEKHPSCEEE